MSWMEDGDDVGSCHVILYSLHAFPYEVAEDRYVLKYRRT